MEYRLEDGSTIEIGWDIDGWDWDDDDYSWLASQLSLLDDGFFIHGGYIRHQKHIDHGDYSLEEFISKVRQLAVGLARPMVRWMDDTGGGDEGLWVEGIRSPIQQDVEALAKVRRRKDSEDKSALAAIRRRHPEWFP